MATEAQVRANRANAQLSTGPRSSTGKAASAINGLRHGFRSQSVLLPSDDPAEYEELLNELTSYFQPADLVERRYVREMADAEWRLRRTRRNIESALTRKYLELQAASPETPGDLEALAFEALHRDGSSFSHYLRYESKYERQYSRAFNEWTRYQALLTKLQVAPIRNRTTEPNPPARQPSPQTSPEPEETAAEPSSVPRNAPCPCGSGQKYKRCCGRNAAPVLRFPRPPAPAGRHSASRLAGSLPE